jgi:ubiquinone/menaquinone biosynthesis C-methylase UbiE
VTTPQPALKTSSTGQPATDADWLDAHFAAFRPEYEVAVRGVGIAPGWRVLDAGCGGGGFVPLLADLVGPTGRVDALDLAEDNVARLRTRLAAEPPPCPVEARVGSLLALPYPDAAFDTVWLANVLMYLTDEELVLGLAECHRVLRPGGLLAAKEMDGGLSLVAPADPLLLARWTDVARRTMVPVRGILRSRALHGWWQRAGFEGVRQRAVLIERRAPLDPANRRYLAELMAFWRALAEQLPIDDADRTTWRALSDPTAPAYLLAQSDFYHCDGQYVVTGRVPSPAVAAG